MPGRVLIVEDEYLIRLLLEDMLEELGFKVAGVASSVAEGKEQAGTAEIDLAILDVNIDGEQVFPVAEVLRAATCRSASSPATAPKACRSTTGACRPCRSRSRWRTSRRRWRS